MKKLINTFLVITFSFNINAQDATTDFDYADVIQVTNVYGISPTFPNSEGWIEILADDGSPGSLSGMAHTTVWTLNQQIKPAAFVSDYNAQFGAHFRFECDLSELPFVRGETSDGYELPIQELEQDGTFHVYRRKKLSTYESGNYVDAPFEKEKVQYWQDFTITWFVSDDEDLEHSKWKEIGKTAFPLYVTHKEPIVGDNQNDEYDRETQILHSTLNLSCKNGINKSDESDIVSSIYTEFTNQCVKRVNDKAEEIGNCLGYWQPPNLSGDCQSVSEFLLNGNARCNEWADFFNDMIKLQGITSSKITIIEYTENSLIPQDLDMRLRLAIDQEFEDCFVSLNTNDHSVLIVNKYNFSLDKIYVDEFYTEKILCNDKTVTKANIEGIPAQGVGNGSPISVFWNHAIVLHDGKYYDPSYGVSPKTSKIDYEDSAFAGFGVSPQIFYFDQNDEFKTSLFLFLDDENTLGDQQTIINP